MLKLKTGCWPLQSRAPPPFHTKYVLMLGFVRVPLEVKGGICLEI